MNIDTFTISRCIFLIFIVVISTYFIVESKKSKTNVEKFAEEAKTPQLIATSPVGGSMEALDPKNKQANDPKEPLPKEDPKYIDKTNEKVITKEVIAAYTELYKVEPEPEEIEFYVSYVKTRNVTREQLREVISTSAPTLQKTFYSRKNKDTPDEIFGNENEIIEIFNEILQRNPDRVELYSYGKMMHTDKTFTEDKLRQILISSEEFKRMERTQNNKVFVNLQSNMTDRQLTIQVTKIYTDVTKKDYLDEDTLKFLKKKFVEFDLNVATMTTFIENYMNGKPFPPKSTNTEVAKDTPVQRLPDNLVNSQQDVLNKQNIAPEANKEKIQIDIKQVPAPQDSSKNTKNLENFQEGTTVISDSKIYNFFGRDGANKDVISSIMEDGITSNGNINTSTLIANIKKGTSDNATCRFSKNAAEDELVSKYKQELADYINERNKSHLGNVCSRNKKYINADEDMVLFPEFKWSVPQQFPPVCMGKTETVNPTTDQTALIGTLLPAAQETQVGSILPVFPPV